MSNTGASDALSSHTSPLAGLRIVDLSVNLPGPLASAKLRDLGAHVTAIVPPGGDPLRAASPDWWAELSVGKESRILNLKVPEDRGQLDALLERADLLLTASRPSALRRLDLDWTRLRAQHPRLCCVAIVGHAAPHEERAGHDLTYQAETGLCEPPDLPRTLIADLAGAERAVSAALALLLARERTGAAGHATVSLADAAQDFAAPYHYRLTTPSGVLGGGFAPYNLYATADGWVAIAALEPHFWQRFCQVSGHTELREWDRRQQVEAAAAVFGQRATAFWLELARSHDLPIADAAPHTP